MARGYRPHEPRRGQDRKILHLSTGSNIQQLPINPRTYELLAPRKPKAHDDKKQPKQDNGGIIHITRRDGQFGREADEGSYHRNKQRRKKIADVAQGAEIEGSSRKGGLAASGDDDALRDGVGDALERRKNEQGTLAKLYAEAFGGLNGTLERG